MDINKELTLEEMMDELDNCVKKLEEDSISLEESFQIYEQGMKYVKACNDRIDKVEKDVLKLEEDGSATLFDPV
ncbi:MAG: exodeoxyribonuclease VII small subunit [Lachnospiraceae bacterium]|nr:exodeoxyribonuclease VII small subunit [Candidatus Colinaster scatohippi]